MIYAIAAFALGFAPSDTVTREDITFDTFLTRHGKTYTAAERASREATFDWAKKVVLAHNRQYEAGETTWYMALNHLADQTPAELAKLRSTKYDPSSFATERLTATAPNPASVDWRVKGAVTKVKNQGGCGSCWAFSATETVESHYQIASGKLLTLAPQTYVNCVQNPKQCGGTGGCEGATMELAFNLTKTSGIALESDMPYTAHDEACPAAYKAAATLDSYVKLPANDAVALESALATVGPIAVNVAANWRNYGGGIFSGGCTEDNCALDHVVVAYGYRKNVGRSTGYWLIRNSWGPSWGEEGYIRLTRGYDKTTFVDKTPADGVACKPFPKNQSVSGESGVLFDMSYPTGVRKAA